MFSLSNFIFWVVSWSFEEADGEDSDETSKSRTSLMFVHNSVCASLTTYSTYHAG